MVQLSLIAPFPKLVTKSGSGKRLAMLGDKVRKISLRMQIDLVSQIGQHRNIELHIRLLPAHRQLAVSNVLSSHAYHVGARVPGLQQQLKREPCLGS